MQNVINMKRNMRNGISFIKQAGVSSLLFIVLVGLSLTVLTVGYMSTMRNLQSSATTTHAQTQAQMQAMIGYHALVKYLKKESTINIDKIESGTVSGGSEVIEFTRVSCGAGRYCFDIVGKSGGATAILRTDLIIVQGEGLSAHEGSVFAGGLKVQKKETLQALTENVAISVGANIKEGLESGNIYLSNGKTVVDYQPETDGIKVNKFDGGLDLIPAIDMKAHANYIFKHVGDTISCEKQNTNLQNSATSITCPYYEEVERDYAITRGKSSGTDVWIVDVNKLIQSKIEMGQKFDGIFWFDGDVVIRLPDSENDSSKYFRNTIITTGNLTIEKDASSSSGELNVFSPYDYIVATDITAQILMIDKQLKTGKDSNGNNLTEAQKLLLGENRADLLSLQLATMKVRLAEVCLNSERPANLCKDFTQQQVDDIENYDDILAVDNVFLKDTSKYPTSLFTLIGMADEGFVVHADNQTQTKLFGNLIGSKGAGNTGKASGKFAGTGQIEVIGNLIVAKDMDLTEMKGDVKIKLGQTKASGNIIPIKNNTFTTKGIRYM
ncbi:hypothetical protein MUB05_05545 [Acinetobacter indicus]|uniref:hypothetical protein n=1 Tax=Acinetobacter TaxID=469 RepID=UPI0015D1EBDB|nr:MULTISPECIES: hypothetical protein [Acinetobacter]MCP0916047.1 hypothetical protein [Acinetobacter indicus]MCP0919173.1 hypothetical protein [Acinetobacter indicus]MCP0921839.1 hypothetical protein [Acinetobacter indicus]